MLARFGFCLATIVALFMPSNVFAQNDGDTSPASNEQATIVETAIAAGSFKTLVTAVQAAELVETLSGPGPFTVFAPTDEAFAKLPKGRSKRY